MAVKKWFSNYWREHGTKLICTVIGVLEAAREIPGIIPDSWDKWAALTIVVLAGGGVRRGFTNTKNAV